MSFIINRTIQLVSLVALLALALCGQTAPAQEGAPAAPTDPLGRSTPRGTVFQFLRVAQDRNFGAAAQYLKIGGGPASPQSNAARRLAEQLKAVLDRKLEILPGAISDGPEGNLADGFPSDREQAGSIATDSGALPIMLHRIKQIDGNQVWLFASETLDRIPEVHQSLAPSIIETYLPNSWIKVHFFGLALWRWIALLLLLPTAVGLAWLITAVLFRVTSVVVRRTAWAFDDDLTSMLRGPLRLLLTVWVFHSGMAVVELSFLARRSIGVMRDAAGGDRRVVVRSAIHRLWI